MGCCDNPIGDTPGVIPFRRMSETHPCPRMLHNNTAQYGGAADGTQSFSKPSDERQEIQAPFASQADQPQCRRDRLRVRDSFCRGTVRARFRTRALVQDLHRRSSSTRRLARCMQDQDGGDGIDRRVLDPDLRDSRGTRLRSRARQLAARQERPGAKDRCPGLSVDPGASQRRTPARQLPASRGDRHAACVSAAPR